MTFVDYCERVSILKNQSQKSLPKFVLDSTPCAIGVVLHNFVLCSSYRYQRTQVLDTTVVSNYDQTNLKCAKALAIQIILS